jgi:hypothetical protein
MFQLPLEIWVLIIDYLAEDEDSAMAALSACSLVETRFIPLARKHLFKILYFQAEGPWIAYRMARLKPCLPAISPYVRELDFDYSDDLALGIPDLSIYISILASAVGSRVETLSLCLPDMSECGDFATRLTQDFPYLRHLRFSGVTFQSVDLMAGYLAACPRLRSFKLENCWFDNLDFRKDRYLPPLQELQLNLNQPSDLILSWAMHSGLASTLQHLDVWVIQERDYEAIATFMASPVLRLLALSITVDFHSSPSGMFRSVRMSITN